MTKNIHIPIKMDEGSAALVTMKGGKCKLLQLLRQQDLEKHFDENGKVKDGRGLGYYKTKYFKFIPKTNLNQQDSDALNNKFSHYMSVDGERYPIEAFQVKVRKASLKIFCLNP